MTTEATIASALQRALGDDYLVTCDLSSEKPVCKLLVQKGEASHHARTVLDDPDALAVDMPGLENWAREGARVIKAAMP